MCLSGYARPAKQLKFWFKVANLFIESILTYLLFVWIESRKLIVNLLRLVYFLLQML